MVKIFKYTFMSYFAVLSRNLIDGNEKNKKKFFSVSM